MTIGNRRRASSHLPTGLTQLFYCFATAGTQSGSSRGTCRPIDCDLSGPKTLALAPAHLLVHRTLPISSSPGCALVSPHFYQGCLVNWIAPCFQFRNPEPAHVYLPDVATVLF